MSTNRYELRGVLGQGGCGIVHRAWDAHSQREVALKTLVPPYDTEAVRRFEREARALLALKHPNVVPALDVGTGPPPFLIMELVNGGSLQDRLRKGPLPIDEVVDLGQILAEALHFVHARRVVHRDLKPANVLLHDERPLLADFGLARGPRGHTITATGEVLGTPGYLAPEQAMSNPIGPWTDVYGLGATLYALLTGRPPFQAKSALETITQVVTLAPQPPRALRADAPEWLERVILRCLEKKPGDRYTDMLALADALLPSASDAPASPRSGSAWVAAGVAGLALLGAGLGVAWTRSSPTPAAQQEPPPTPPSTSAPTELLPVELSAKTPSLPEPPDPQRLFDAPLTEWASALPPRSRVEGPGVWPRPDLLARWTRFLIAGDHEVVREEVLSQFPAVGSSPEQAFLASEVFRCLNVSDAELEVLRPFRSSDWACARRCAQLGAVELHDLDPERLGVLPADVEIDRALARCMQLAEEAESREAIELMRELRVRDLSPRQRAEWACTGVRARWFGAASRKELLAPIDALLLQPDGLSQAMRQELLRVRLLLVGSVSPRDPAARFDTARRLLSWNPVSVVALAEGCGALLELKRLNEAQELAGWLLEAGADPISSWNAAFMYCGCALDSSELRKDPTLLIRAIETVYFTGRGDLPPKLWGNLHRLLALADTPETRADVRRLARAAQEEGNPDYYAEYLSSEGRATALLDGLAAAEARATAAWRGGQARLELLRLDLALYARSRQALEDPNNPKRLATLYRALREVSGHPAMRALEGKVLLAEYHTTAGQKYLAYDYTLQALALTDPGKQFGARLEVLRKALGIESRQALTRPTLTELDPSVTEFEPRASGALPRCAGTTADGLGPERYARWKRIEFEGHYAQLRSEVFAAFPAVEGNPNAVWQVATALRRLRLFSWEARLLFEFQSASWRCALRYAVLNATREGEFDTLQPQAPATETSLARAEWNLSRAAKADTNARLERGQQLLASIDPQSLTPNQRAEWFWGWAQFLCQANRYDKAPALLTDLDRFLAAAENELSEERLVRLLEIRGKVQRNLDDLDEAARSYRAALSWNRLDPQLLAPLAWTLASAGRYPEALRAAEWLLRAAPRSRYADWAAAAAAHALTDAPELPSSLRGAEGVLIASGMRHALRLGKRNLRYVQTLQPLCYLARDVEDWTQLRELARLGLDSKTEQQGFHMFATLAVYNLEGEAAHKRYLAEIPSGNDRGFAALGLALWLAKHRGVDLEGSRQLAEDVLREHPDDPILTLLAAKVFARLGELGRAREILQDVRRKRPDDAALLREITKLERSWAGESDPPR